MADVNLDQSGGSVTARLALLPVDFQLLPYAEDEAPQYGNTTKLGENPNL
jgi:hypothetical protein